MYEIAETLGSLGAKLEIPSFTKDQDQMRAEDVEDTRVIANVRIHVEWVIGNLRKKYSIINGTLPIDYLFSKGDGTEKLTTLDKIVHVACALINLVSFSSPAWVKGSHNLFWKSKDNKGSNCLQKMENFLCKKFFPLRWLSWLV